MLPTFLFYLSDTIHSVWFLIGWTLFISFRIIFNSFSSVNLCLLSFYNLWSKSLIFCYFSAFIISYLFLIFFASSWSYSWHFFVYSYSFTIISNFYENFWSYLYFFLVSSSSLANSVPHLFVVSLTISLTWFFVCSRIIWCSLYFLSWLSNNRWYLCLSDVTSFKHTLLTSSISELIVVSLASSMSLSFSTKRSSFLLIYRFNL